MKEGSLYCLNSISMKYCVHFWHFYEGRTKYPYLRERFVIVSRHIEAFSPHIFQFLILLSYECFQPKFNQAKSVFGMSRIIQVCDDLMACGQSARTHGKSCYYSTNKLNYLSLQLYFLAR